MSKLKTNSNNIATFQNVPIKELEDVIEEHNKHKLELMSSIKYELKIDNKLFTHHKHLTKDDVINKLLSYTTFNDKYIYENSILMLDKEMYHKYYFCNMYYIENSNLFFFIKKDLITSLHTKMFSDKQLINNFKLFPEVNTISNTDIDNVSYEIKFDKFIHNSSAAYLFFEEGSSLFINYNNKEQIAFVQLKIREQYECGFSKPEMTKICDNYPVSELMVDWWIFRGWDKEYAIEKIRQTQISRGKKFGEKRLEHPERYIGFNPTSLEYYLKKGYSEEDAKRMLHDRQSLTSLKSYIKRYGLEEGTKRFNERNEKWQNTLKSRDDYMDIVNKRSHGACFSNISQELFDSVRLLLLDNGYDMKMYYPRLNHEWGFGVKEYGSFLYDFVIPEIKYAIEYNGERYHPNPEIYNTVKKQKEWSNPFGVTFDEQYTKDKIKNQAIRDKGFKLDIVWNKDYLANKSKVVKEIYETIVKIYNEKHTKEEL